MGSKFKRFRFAFILAANYLLMRIGPHEIKITFVKKIMTETAAHEEMLKYFSKLNKEEQLSVVGLLKTFITGRKTFERQSLEEYNDELEQGAAEIEAGNYITHEQVKERLANKNL